jgi:hypothetical protein
MSAVINRSDMIVIFFMIALFYAKVAKIMPDVSNPCTPVLPDHACDDQKQSGRCSKIDRFVNDEMQQYQ